MFAGSKTSAFERLVDKAASQLLLEPDWDSILQICDSVRQEDVTGKQAINSIRKKILHENPNVALFALQVLESVVKNCGSMIHAEIASKEFMEFLKEFIKSRNDPTKEKILELIQCWSHAFRTEPAYKSVQDTYHLMKMEGYQFPVLKEADAMFAAEKAPEWKDGEYCHKCRTQFSVVNRKHHCRSCGQIFCQKCSAKMCIIPKFGIEREVRVCDTCYDELNKSGIKKPSESELPPEYLASPLSQQPQVSHQGSPRKINKTPPARSDLEIQEEEELQLAIALSQSEAETKSKPLKSNNKSNYPFINSTASTTEPAKSITNDVSSVLDTSDMDPELARYLNRNYWEQKQQGGNDNKANAAVPSAPAVISEAKVAAPAKIVEKYQNGEVGDDDQFVNALRSSIEIFVNRMKSNSQRGRSIANDSSVQTLFMTLNSMHPQLMELIQKQEESRYNFEAMQDKLAQIRDAREALDALRDEHREKKRQEQEELERQRQIQIAQKLDIMRQKKQEYLEYQRQLALQRMQEQEREMQFRMEQQKQMQQMRAQYGSYYPQMYPPPNPGQNFSPVNSVDNSPHHQPSMMGQYMPPTMMQAPMNVPQGLPYNNYVNQPPPPNYQNSSIPGGYQNTQYQIPSYQNNQPLPQHNAQISNIPQMQYPPEYSSFNMQAMNNSLPPQIPSMGPPSQQMPPMGTQLVPNQQISPMGTHTMGATQYYQQPQQYNQMNIQGQQPQMIEENTMNMQQQQQPTEHVQQLISFE